MVPYEFNAIDKDEMKMNDRHTDKYYEDLVVLLRKYFEYSNKLVVCRDAAEAIEELLIKNQFHRDLLDKAGGK